MTTLKKIIINMNFGNKEQVSHYFLASFSFNNYIIFINNS